MKGTIKRVTQQSSSTDKRTYIFFGDPATRLEMSPPTIHVTVDGEPQVNDDFLESPGADVPVTFVADIIDETEIDPSTISLVETDVGEIDPSLYTLEAMTDTTSELGRWYRLTYTAPLRDWSYDVRISATDMNGQTTTFVLHIAAGRRLFIRDVANHPNPFYQGTRIIYLLNQSDATVTISIYTVGGRLVKVFRDAPSELNYNEVEWDGVDADGDPVANGLYLYVIEARGADGTRATAPVGRMVRAR